MPFLPSIQGTAAWRNRQPPNHQETGREAFLLHLPYSLMIFSASMQGKTYKKNCTVARSELRYLRCLHVDKDGRNIVGEMVVNKAIAADVLDILKKLYEAKYPIERMRLIDYWDADDERAMRANNSSSFNFRFISHTHTVSKHGKGLAVDINTLYNPYHKRLKNGKEVVEPATARPYLDRSKHHVYMIKKATSATGSSRRKDSDGEATGNTARITSTSRNRNRQD